MDNDALGAPRSSSCMMWGPWELSEESPMADGCSHIYLDDVDVEGKQMVDTLALGEVNGLAKDHYQEVGQAHKHPNHCDIMASGELNFTASTTFADPGEHLAAEFSWDQQMMDCNNNFTDSGEEKGLASSPEHAPTNISEDPVDLNLRHAIGLALTGGVVTETAVDEGPMDTMIPYTDMIEREDFFFTDDGLDGGSTELVPIPAVSSSNYSRICGERDPEMDPSTLGDEDVNDAQSTGMSAQSLDSCINREDCPRGANGEEKSLDGLESEEAECEVICQFPPEDSAAGTRRVEQPGKGVPGGTVTETQHACYVHHPTREFQHMEDPTADIRAKSIDDNPGELHGTDVPQLKHGYKTEAVGVEVEPVDDLSHGGELHMTIDPQLKHGPAVIKSEPSDEAHHSCEPHHDRTDVPQSERGTSDDVKVEPMNVLSQGGELHTDIDPPSNHGPSVGIKSDNSDPLDKVHHTSDLHHNVDVPQSVHGTAVCPEVEPLDEVYHGAETPMIGDSLPNNGTTVGIKSEPIDEIHQVIRLHHKYVPQSVHGTAVCPKMELIDGVHQVSELHGKDAPQSVHGTAVCPKTEPIDGVHQVSKLHHKDVPQSVHGTAAVCPKMEPIDGVHQVSELHRKDAPQSVHGTAVCPKTEPIDGVHQVSKLHHKDVPQSVHGTAVCPKMEPMDGVYQVSELHHKDGPLSVHGTAVCPKMEPMDGVRQVSELHHKDVPQSVHGTAAVCPKMEPMDGVHQVSKLQHTNVPQSEHGLALGSKSVPVDEVRHARELQLTDDTQAEHDTAVSIKVESMDTASMPITGYSRPKHAPAVGIRPPRSSDPQSKHDTKRKLPGEDEDEDDMPLDERMRRRKREATPVTTCPDIARRKISLARPLESAHNGSEQHLTDYPKSKHGTTAGMKLEPVDGVHNSSHLSSSSEPQRKHATSAGVKMEQSDDDDEDVMSLDQRLRRMRGEVTSVAITPDIIGHPEVTVRLEEDHAGRATVKEETDKPSADVTAVRRRSKKSRKSDDRAATSGHLLKETRAEAAATPEDAARNPGVETHPGQHHPPTIASRRGPPEETLIKEECNGERVKLDRKKFKCEHCDKRFAKSKDLQCHSYRHTDRYRCEVCGRGCTSPSALEHHQRMHSGEKPYRCKYCTKSFGHPSNLVRHERGHRGDKTHKCTYCERTFLTKPEVTMHERALHTGQKPYQCGECGKTFICASRMKLHQKVHSGMKPFSCEVCDGRFASLAMLGIHIRTHTGTCLPCRFCSKSFWYESSRRRHEKVHQSRLPHQCKFCGKGFLEKTHKRVHERMHTGARPFSCSQCDRSFRSAASLKNHEKMHQPRERLECSECGKDYASSKSLSDHRRTHTGDLLYCEVCGKSCTTPGKLQRHMEVHSEERQRPYECEECGKSFHAKGSLLKHQVTHKEEKNHECKVCKKRFKLPETLHTHQIIHTGEQPFQCRFCNRLFNKQNNMRIHELKIHSAARQAHEPRTPYLDIERHFRCRFCGGLYGSKGSKTLHERTVHSAD